MNSSISSSSPVSQPVRKGASLRLVALVLLLFFGALETFTRLEFFRMSKDLRRFVTYPARAARLHRSPGLRLALLGNSATERGIDMATLKRGLAARHIKATTDIFIADASHLSTWKWMANHLFWNPRRAPDVLVVPYFNTSLADGNEIEIGRLAQFFTAPQEIPAALHDLPDTASRLDLAASTLSATYAARTRLKERLLSLLVPNYQNFTAELQAINQPQPRVPKSPSYRDLNQFLHAAQINHCRLIFVALPLRNSTVPPDLTLPHRIRSAGAQFLDLRHTPGLKPTLFADSIHLNPQGRAFFTPRFLKVLTPLLTPK